MPPETHRTGLHIAFDREADQDLVPESAHENEEGPEEQELIVLQQIAQ